MDSLNNEFLEEQRIFLKQRVRPLVFRDEMSYDAMGNRSDHRTTTTMGNRYSSFHGTSVSCELGAAELTLEVVAYESPLMQQEGSADWKHRTMR